MVEPPSKPRVRPIQKSNDLKDNKATPMTLRTIVRKCVSCCLFAKPDAQTPAATARVPTQTPIHEGATKSAEV